jgi:REP element-mobilizing transposase RayT
MRLTANTNDTYFVTLTVVNWIDVFTRLSYRDMLIDNLKYCQNEKGLEVYSYVIMSNHIHLIGRSIEEPLSNVLRDFKTFTSKELFKAIKNNPKESRKDWIIKLLQNAGQKNVLNKNHQFWQNNNQPILISSTRQFLVKQNYIHQNPVQAGIVENDFDYLYSSANENNPLEVDEY